MPTAESFNTRLQRDTRKSLDAQAVELGFDTWQAFLDSRTAATPPASAQPPEPETPPAEPEPDATPATPPALDEAARLRLAIEIGGDKGLHPALLSRLQGNTRAELEADADRLAQVVQRAPAGPGIPPAPRNGQTVTFTRAQLRDPAFVREHAADIQRAASEGRIVDS